MFLIYYLPKSNQNQISNLNRSLTPSENRPITPSEMEAVNEDLPTGPRAERRNPEAISNW